MIVVSATALTFVTDAATDAVKIVRAALRRSGPIRVADPELSQP